MLPKRIYIENFMAHVLSDIDCTKFTSCLIVGKNKNNPNISNGVGKSTIYKAIDFVLYGEYACDKIEEIIRDGAEFCKVIFEFEISGADYQVIRQRGKSGTHIYLNKFIIDKWESITAKTNTQTEMELLKLIKISYKAFKNSICFAQSDLDGISSATPDKRKELLKEPLNILIYNKYHKIAKKRLDLVNNELNIIINKINDLGDPSEELTIVNDKIFEAERKLISKRDLYNEFQNNLVQKKVELSELEKLIALDSIDINNKLIEIKSRIKEIELEISRTNLELESSLNKMKNFKLDLSAKVSGLQDKIDSLKKIKSEELRTHTTVQNELNLCIDKEQRGRVLIAGLESDKIKLSKILPEVGECSFCHQEVSDHYREKCILESSKKLENVIQDLTKYNEILAKCINKRKKLEQEQKDISKKIAQIDFYELEIANWKNNINKIQELVNQYNETINNKNNDLARLNSSLDVLMVKKEILVENIKKTNIDELNNKIFFTKNELITIENNIKILLQDISSSDTLLGILKEKKSNISDNIIKLEKLLNDKKILNGKINILSKVSDAFADKIPKTIINSVLDDIQIEANILLNQLRPGLSFSFIINKENDNLDMNYTVNNLSRSYKLLSGGQKVFLSLAIKLGLSKVIQRRLGVDIKFIELDEIDSSLDEDGVEALAEVIKKMQNDFTIFLITHNKKLKNKFNNFIIVENDENGSNAKYSKVWDE